jgi:hypothetical protein
MHAHTSFISTATNTTRLQLDCVIRKDHMQDSWWPLRSALLSPPAVAAVAAADTTAAAAAHPDCLILIVTIKLGTAAGNHPKHSRKSRELAAEARHGLQNTMLGFAGS